AETPDRPARSPRRADFGRAVLAEDLLRAERQRGSAERTRGPSVRGGDQLLHARAKQGVRAARIRPGGRGRFGPARHERLGPRSVNARPAVERHELAGDQSLERRIDQLTHAAKDMGQLDRRQPLGLAQDLERARGKEGKVAPTDDAVDREAEPRGPTDPSARWETARARVGKQSRLEEVELVADPLLGEV